MCTTFVSGNSTDMSTSCYHCGLDIERSKEIIFDDKSFCCNGCKTVYEIFNQSGLTDYYKYERSPGTTPTGADGRYDFLDNEDIIQRLLDFEEKDTSVISLYPHNTLQFVYLCIGKPR